MRPSFHSLRMVHFSSKAISCPSRSASEEPPVESSEEREAEREDGDFFLVGVGAGRLSPGCGAADASM